MRPDTSHLIPEFLELVGLGRFELPTSRLSSARSNQLSYKPGTGVSNQKPAIRRLLITEYRLLTPEQLVREERETETAASCHWDETCPIVFLSAG